MGLEIYGLQTFSSIVNWFSDWKAFLLFVIVTALVCYFFYKINFINSDKALSPAGHYGYNSMLMIGYGLILFWVSNYVLQMDLVYSMIFTIGFYSISIYILTITLIILRRYKIKKWLLNKLDNINELKFKQQYDLLDKCNNGEHKYLTDLILDLTGTDWIDIPTYEKEKHSNKIYFKPKLDIDMLKEKYNNINIWQDKNMNTKE